MNPRTQTLLQTLENADWFSCVGKRDLPNVAYVSSWLHAAASFPNVEWGNLGLQRGHIIENKASQKSKERAQLWSELLKEFRPLLNEMVKRKTETVVKAQGLPAPFVSNVFGDMLGIAMESEYSDIVAPDFYTNLILDAYLKGHFPCGWEGKYPEGKLIVY